MLQDVPWLSIIFSEQHDTERFILYLANRNSSYPTCQQQPCAVGSGVVGQPHRNAISRQLMRVSSADDRVAFDFGIRNLQTHKRTSLMTSNQHETVGLMEVRRKLRV